MKAPLKTASLAASLLSWLLLSALTVFIMLELRDRARLIRDNDNERFFSVLFTSLRDYSDFGSVIESSPQFRNRIAGFGIFGEDLKPVYQWGVVPPLLDEELLKNSRQAGPGRYVVPDKQGSRVKFILRTRPEAMPPPPEGGEQARRRRSMRLYPAEPGAPPPQVPEPPPGSPPALPEAQAQSADLTPAFALFSALARSKYLYIDVIHPAYWRTQTLTAIFFPFCELGLLILTLFVRRLYLNNREYRERIESQKNLVILGTAASTLAHEIKNPLLSIRLQTGILRKLFAEAGQPSETPFPPAGQQEFAGGAELAVIDGEVERLAAMTWRVNDFLRDAAGNPVPLNSYTVLCEISMRLCGRNIVDEASVRDGMILMDSERARSVFENLIRNALESGGPEREITASIIHGGHDGRFPGRLLIGITDRGRGISPGDLERVFDPFFTSKSTGTGIGLSISRRFIEAAGGTIVLENREGGGAAVRIALPEYTREESCGY
ncbi:MAG: HAMP domain-containing histidine kinase [Treponema sp.]|jgi:two-component system sensor histidine kinase HydH|nr:HAMP domain-containing histidine kinase [Treponema sp.]